MDETKEEESMHSGNLPLLKGEVPRKFDVILKPQNVCLSTETKKVIVLFGYELSP